MYIYHGFVPINALMLFFGLLINVLQLVIAENKRQLKEFVGKQMQD